LWLWLGYGFSGGWLHAKTTLVSLLVLYHWHCGRVLRSFQTGGNEKSHVWFRFYNEMPVLVLFAVVFLVVLKPF
jgi:putative membrane protein